MSLIWFTNLLSKNSLVFFISAILCLGCNQNQKQGEVQFYDLVRDHMQLTVETNASLVNSILDELNRRDDLTEIEKRDIQNLIERLQYISEQSKLIHDYTVQTKVSAELISNLIKYRWGLSRNY